MKRNRTFYSGASVLNSEAQLIQRSQAGDTEAFCELARAYERRIYSLALHYCRDREDAEDLSQEVWLKAYGALRTFRSESSFYTWLRRIMINSFLNHRRSKSLTQQYGEETSGNTRDDAAEISLHDRLVVQKVKTALSEMSPQQRLIVLLKHEEGMTYQEISTEVGCSIGTVKKSVARTITKLRRELRVKDGEESYVSCEAGGY